jgi:DNA-binding NtrC family response regulator
MNHGSEYIKLTVLSRELSALFGNLSSDPTEPAFAVLDADAPRLLIDADAYVEINQASDMYRLVQLRTNAPRIAIETSSKELLFDYVINRLSGIAALEDQSGDRLAMRPLVGCTLESVERALILATLTLCRGNRTDAARLLGISLRTMRNKLRVYRDVVVNVHDNMPLESRGQ